MRSSYRPEKIKKKKTCKEYFDLRFINHKTEINFVKSFYLQQREFLIKFNLTLFFFLIFAIVISTEYLQQLNFLITKVQEIDSSELQAQILNLEQNAINMGTISLILTSLCCTLTFISLVLVLNIDTVLPKQKNVSDPERHSRTSKEAKLLQHCCHLNMMFVTFSHIVFYIFE